LDTALKGAFATRGSAEWDALLAPLGVPAAPVRRPDEFLEGPYAQTGGMHADVAGVGRLLGLGFRVNGAPVAPARGAPKLGADSADVLREAGFTEDEIAALLR
jgi:crotonobetainyl-CoA:carnitine CoA-transferase CaiB-like acyl-CoA transferase